MKLVQIMALVNTEIDAVNAFIEATLQTDVSDSLSPVIDYLMKNRGKQVRPLVSLLLYRTLVGEGELTAEVVQQVAALELIHIGSLIHDDIIDDAEQRRDQPSVNHQWGNQTAVSVGTYMYAVAISLLADLDRPVILGSTTETVKQMCNSELKQLACRYDVSLSKEDCLDIISKKTALLFQTNLYSISILADCSIVDQARFKQLGFDLGILFQLTDDYLDYFGNATLLKKMVGQDFSQGQVTLPLILLLEKNVVSGSIFDHSFETVRQWMVDYHIESQVVEVMQVYEDRVIQALATLPESGYQLALKQLCQAITQRMRMTVA